MITGYSCILGSASSSVGLTKNANAEIVKCSVQKNSIVSVVITVQLMMHIRWIYVLLVIGCHGYSRQLSAEMFT